MHSGNRAKAALLFLATLLPLAPSRSSDTNSFIIAEWPGYIRGPAFDISLVDETIFIASGPAGVALVDVSDPERPARLTNITTSAWIEDFAIHSDLLVLAPHNFELQVFDIEDRTKPRLVGEVEYFGKLPPADLLLTNNFVYLLRDGLHIFDLTHPSSPVQKGFIPITNALSVTVSGDYAYILSHAFGFVIIDISNPDSPIQVGEYINHNDFGHSLLLLGNSVLICGPPSLLGNIEVVDVSNPFSPSRSSVLQLPNDQWKLYASSPVTDTGLFVIASDGLKIANLATPSEPVYSGMVSTPSVRGDVVSDGSFAYVSDYNAGLHIFDVRDPNNPRYVSDYALTGSSFKAAIYRDHAFVCDGMEGVKIFDLAESAFAPVARIPNSVSDYTADIAFTDSLLFVAENSGGLKLIDISIPAEPRTISTIRQVPARPPASGNVWPHRVETFGNWVLATHSANFYVFDVKNPASPQVVTRQNHSNTVTDATMVRDIAYFSTTKGLRVIDLSNPAKPVYLTNFATTNSIYQLTTYSNYLYLPAAAEGLQVFDVSEPEHPHRVGLYNNGFPSHVTIHNNLAFVSDRYAPIIEVLDIQNPSNVVRIARKQIPYRGGNVAIVGNRAFISCFEHGLVVLDISDILGPALSIRPGISPALEIYGRPGCEFVVEQKSTLGSESFWSRSSPSVLQHPRQSVLDLPGTNGFYRAFWTQ